MMLFQVNPALQTQIAFALTLISTLLGLLVGYIALRGYWRSRKRPMMFIAIGFFLVFWTPVLLLAGPVLVPVVGQFIYGMLGEISRILGLICILYGLRIPFTQSD
ncbi:DUF7521 family protein [Natrinema salsiterrestre]|uniref:Uncharacterized protein n=1 Tax=Natrinema salsiterrestre TaxID=2950540 RepID=A0A9Q4L1M1_9EURY|nr:hypothetical protein [Natrinema salsiterrestre]MDF9748238.1 hypothetical protein [Natrinema salsiterrestre]